MAKTLPKATKTTASKYVQDPFDKAFIQLLYTLQTQYGKCLKEAWVEEHIPLPKRHIYQIKEGLRGVAMGRRDSVIKFFEHYDVDPRFFFGTTTKMFRHDPPLFDDFEEESQAKGKTNISSGKLLQAEKLEQEVRALRDQLEACKRENKVLEKLVNQYEKGKK